MLNGKIVFFDDTSNPHYNDPEYQKVGRFNKGLFKGHASCCNYEVEDVCIKIAKAFCKHYYDFDDLTAFDRHGIKFVDLHYVGDDGYSIYDDDAKTCVAGEFGRVYDSKLGIFETQQDILLRNGIKCSTHFTPINSFIDGQVGIYYGMWGNKYPYFWTTNGYGNRYAYLDLLGSEEGWKNESYTMNQIASYMNGHGDWIKYAYEYAGQQISNGTDQAYMHKYFRNVIDTIRSTEGTNIIPVLSLDTIKLSASDNAAVELLCQYCVKNGYSIVPLETARRTAISFNPDTRNNYFPNPAFNQRLLTMFGGNSLTPHAYIPEGFEVQGPDDLNGLLVNVATESGKRVMHIQNSQSHVSILTKVYGLAPGDYVFSMYGRREASANVPITVDIYLLKNSDSYEYNHLYSDILISPVYSYSFNSAEYENASATFTIPEKVERTYVYDDYRDSVTKGFGDNISSVLVLIKFPAGTNGRLHSPSIVKHS